MASATRTSRKLRNRPKPPPRPRIGVSLAQARRMALQLPETTEGPSYGSPGYRVTGKLFARVLEDGESMVVRSSFPMREQLCKDAPEAFKVTPHYQHYEMVVVKLRHVEPLMLQELLLQAWQLTAPSNRKPPRSRRRATR